MNLQLPLTARWFEMTKSGEKTEDYRDITTYFCNRLLLVNGNVKSKDWWHRNFFEGRSIQKTIASLGNNEVSLNPFEYNIMTLGYPKKDDLSKRLVYFHTGIEIRTGNPKWGAEPNKLYFVIKHGVRI